SLAILSPTRSLQARGPQLGRIHHLVLRALGAGDRHRRMLCACCGQVGAEKPCGGPSTAVPFLRISGGVSCSALPVCSRLLVAFLHAADKLVSTGSGSCDSVCHGVSRAARSSNVGEHCPKIWAVQSNG